MGLESPAIHHGQPTLGQAALGSKFAPGVEPPAYTPTSFWEQFKDCSSHRVTRDVMGAVLDHGVPAPKFASGAVEALVKATAPLMSTSPKEHRNYGHLFNIGERKLDIGRGKDYHSTLHALLSPDGRDDLNRFRRMNFSEAQFKPMPFKTYVQKVLVEENLRSFRDDLTQGKIFSGLFKLGWFGLGALPVVNRTYDRWQQTHSKAEAGKTLAKETTKAGIAWEIGRIGIMLAERLCPAGWLMTLAGSLGLGLFSAVAHTTLDKAWK